MKRCPNGKRRVGRICKRKPRAKAKRRATKRKKSPLTKWFIRGNRAKGTKKRYLTQRELDAFRMKRAREIWARRDAKRARRIRQRRPGHAREEQQDYGQNYPRDAFEAEYGFRRGSAAHHENLRQQKRNYNTTYADGTRRARPLRPGDKGYWS